MNNDRSISEGKACFLIKDKSLFEGWDSFVYEWLRKEGFVSWGKKGDCSRVDWVYININSKVYAPGIPGIRVTSEIGPHAITFDEFLLIYNIYKKYEGLKPLEMSDK